jgi:hypothetical protein
MSAAYIANTSTVNRILRDNPDLNERDNLGNTALHYACYSGSEDIVSILLYNGANANICSNKGNIPLHIAMYSDSNTLIKKVMEHTLNLNTYNHDSICPIIIAAELDNTEIVIYMLEKGADPNVRNGDKLSLLSIALLNRNHKLVDYLLANTTPISYDNRDYTNPMYIAKVGHTHSETQKLREAGYQSSFRPHFNGTIVRFGSYFNAGDVFFRTSLNVYDYSKRLQLGLGTSYSILSKKVYDLDQPNTTYHETEKLLIEGMISKMIPLRISQNINNELGIYMGLNAQVDFFSQTDRISYYPQVNSGLYFRTHMFILSLGYTYSNYHFVDISPHYLDVSLGFIDNAKRPQIRPYFPNWI